MQDGPKVCQYHFLHMNNFLGVPPRKNKFEEHRCHLCMSYALHYKKIDWRENNQEMH